MTTLIPSIFSGEINSIIFNTNKLRVQMVPEYLKPGVYIEEISHSNAMPSIEDIGLLPAALSRFKELSNHVNQVRHFHDDMNSSPILKVSGIAVLFSGPGSIGKTMGAKILASETKLDLYKVDLSSNVSKYIGETEKNLDKVFELAGRGILFFDEADALFVKRTEVKDAHYRFANNEIGYLLSKIESFDGITILTTNSLENIDDAFLHRLYTVIEFPLPYVAQRTSIWVQILRWITCRILNNDSHR